MGNVPPGFVWDLVWHNATHMQDNPYIDIVFVVVMFDVLTGSLKAWKTNAKRHVNSTKGLNGLAKHSLILAMIAFLYPIISAMGLETEVNIVLTYFIYQYGVSVMENLDVLGVPFPEPIRKKFEKMASRSDEFIKEDEEDNDKIK